MTKTVTRKQWIEALKSGEYKQGQGYLRTKDDEFCCIGVFCKLADVEMTLDDGKQYYWVTVDDGDGWSRNSRTMPHEYFLEKEAHLIYNGVYQYGELAQLNDSGRTFEQIADLLIFDTWIRGLE